ncbi:MAG: hypothetical protein ABWX65_04680 [Mycetocola sp.]
MIDPTLGVADGAALSDVARTRALDLLDEQRRRIEALVDSVADGQARLGRTTASLAWRSASRYEFDRRITELHGLLARGAGALRAALVECDRARELLRAGASVERRGDGWTTGFAGYPAAGRRR